MKLIITIEMDNVAFEDGISGDGQEVARILRVIAEDVNGTAMADDYKLELMDYYENKVGEAVVWSKITEVNHKQRRRP